MCSNHLESLLKLGLFQKIEGCQFLNILWGSKAKQMAYCFHRNEHSVASVFCA